MRRFFQTLSLTIGLSLCASACWAAKPSVQMTDSKHDRSRIIQTEPPKLETLAPKEPVVRLVTYRKGYECTRYLATTRVVGILAVTHPDFNTDIPECLYKTYNEPITQSMQLINYTAVGATTFEVWQWETGLGLLFVVLYRSIYDTSI